MSKSKSKSKITDRLTIGSWIQIGHPAVVDIMATAGFDWLTVDLEHSAITIQEAEELIRIIELKGVVPLVRLSSNNAEQIKRVMDSGAHGIIVPMVNSTEDARKAISAAKYPPVGTRSFGLARAQGYGTKFSEYLNWEKESAIVVVQIEHIDAVNNLESIFSVPGLDGYFVGPYDLSGSLGIPGEFEHPEYIQTMAEIKRIADKKKIPGGLHLVEPDPDKLVQSINEGHRFIAYGMDTRILDTGCRLGLNSIKKLMA